MSPRRVTTVLALLVLVFAAGAGAQGLGATAAKEKQKRAEKTKTQEPARSFTNDDLDKSRPPGAKGQAANDTTPATEAEEGSPSPPAEDRLQQERPYLDAITAAQAEVSAAQARIRQLSEKLNPMSLSYIYGAGGSNDANEELRVRAELRDSEAQLLSAKQAVVQANQNLQDFRAGRPSSVER